MKIKPLFSNVFGFIHKEKSCSVLFFVANLFDIEIKTNKRFTITLFSSNKWQFVLTDKHFKIISFLIIFDFQRDLTVPFMYEISLIENYYIAYALLNYQQNDLIYLLDKKDHLKRIRLHQHQDCHGFSLFCNLK